MTTWREKLKQRSQQAVQNKDTRGLGRKNVLDLSLINLPEWSPRSGREHKNYIDIMPWRVTQPWYKTLHTRSGDFTKLDVGDVDYKLEVAVHKYVGPSKDMFLCLREALTKDDPVCQDMFAEYQKRKEGSKDFDKDKAKALQPSWRCFYIVYDYDDDKKGFQFWEASYELFEKYLLEEMKVYVDKGGLIVPWDLIDGRSIEWKGREKTLGNNKFVEAESIEFRARDPYDESVLDKIPSLDKALIIPTYEQIRMSHYGLGEGDEETLPDETGRDKADQPAETSRARGRGQSEETRPTPTSRTRGGSAPAPAPDTPKEVAKEEFACPAGGKFGEDCNRIKACQDEACSQEVFEACMKRADELSKAAKAAVPEAAGSRTRGTSAVEQPSGGRTRGRR